MTKYLLSRILRSLVSVVIVVAVIMVMIYSFLDKQSVLATDPVWSKQKMNDKTVYEMQQWEQYGYLDYVNYTEFMKSKLTSGEIDQETYDSAIKLNKDAAGTNEIAEKYIAEFTEFYADQGYEIVPLEGKLKPGTRKYHDGGKPRLYAYKEIPVIKRLGSYLGGLLFRDHINRAEGDVGERGLTFTWRDPAYGGKKFSPAVMGNGTHHKYLIYCDNSFPYIHQNLLTIKLGKSYSVNKGIDVFETMTQSQGGMEYSEVTYPTGLVEYTADDLHSATYVGGSRASGELNQKYYVDDYTNVGTVRNGRSQMGYSFLIGIISVIMAYLLAVPMGITMALKKDKLVDKLGTFYIVFITAVPSLAYIYMFRAVGGWFKLPTTFNLEKPTTVMYILPIVSLALPSVANLMKWLRRYMIDQMNADYVKFARSGGLSEGEIFRKHILKNAIIPIAHGVPASILGAMTGAIITERVYLVPGVGNVLTKAINEYDNGVIVGVALFYALLTVTSVILGDVVMSILDPRISFTKKER